MCGFCAAAFLKENCGEDGYGTAQADLSDIANTIPGDQTTTEVITVGATRQETLETVGDKDWFQLSLNAGDAVQIDLSGLDHDATNDLGKLRDPLVRIYDGQGNLLGENDDIGLRNRDSRLTFTASESDTFYIEVDSYNSNGAGDYQLAVQAVVPPPPATPLDAIYGNKTLDDTDTILVYFAEAGDSYRFLRDTYVATGMTQYEQDQYFSVFEGVEQFADIDFEITTDRELADLEVATSTLPTSPSGTLLGFFNFPTSSGDGRFGVINDDFAGYSDQAGGSLDTGGFMYGVAIHEFGHGLGLGHPHDTGNGTNVMQGVSGADDRGDYDLNSAAYTAMSYAEGSLIAGIADSDANTGHGATFGALDIAVLQDMYGVNTTHATGDDTYTLIDSNSTGSAAGYYTIWDAGGTDGIAYDGTKDAVIDLREATLQYEEGGGGFLSYVNGVIGGITIANGVTIENATSGSGNDKLTGNAAANSLLAGAGNDVVNGGAGDDYLQGQDGDDTLDGGLGNDTVWGSNGNDVITDTDGRNKMGGGSGNDILTDGDGIATLAGGSGDDQLLGGGGGDYLFGGGGNDTLSGQDGDDEMSGKTGNDTFVFDAGADKIKDFEATTDLERIDLSAVNAVITDFTDLVDNHMSQSGSDVVIDLLDGTNSLTLLNTQLADLNEVEFVFV